MTAPTDVLFTGASQVEGETTTWTVTFATSAARQIRPGDSINVYFDNAGMSFDLSALTWSNVTFGANWDATTTLDPAFFGTFTVTGNRILMIPRTTAAATTLLPALTVGSLTISGIVNPSAQSFVPTFVGVNDVANILSLYTNRDLNGVGSSQNPTVISAVPATGPSFIPSIPGIPSIPSIAS